MEHEDCKDRQKASGPSEDHVSFDDLDNNDTPKTEQTLSFDGQFWYNIMMIIIDVLSKAK